MNRSRNRKKHNHCSECGEALFDIEETVLDTHRCDPVVLKRIASSTDACMTREYEPRTSQDFNTRLSNGFAMMDDDYEPE